MSTPTKDRLAWLLSQLDNLNNGGNIRYDGNTTFQGARAELVDIIDTYQDHSAEPAPVNLVAMTADQVDQVVARVVAAIPPAADYAQIVTAITDEIHASDVSVIAAVVQTGKDTVAALLPSGAAPAPATDPAPAGEPAAA